MEHVILTGALGAGYGALTGDIGGMYTIWKMGNFTFILWYL